MVRLDDIMGVLQFARRPLSTPEIARILTDRDRRSYYTSVRSCVFTKLNREAERGNVVKQTVRHPKVILWSLPEAGA